MKASLADLIKVLQLERLEINLFRGESRDIGSPQVFGGQVLGQALMAAFGTIEGRMVHSLHAYFLRAGDYNAPIVYEVDRSRDGTSFSSRRVVAIQHGQQIFHMSASFQIEEQGLEHQITMPQVTPPEDLPLQERYRGASIGREVRQDFPFEFRMRPRETWSDKGQLYFWFRTADAVPDDEVLHRCLLAYVSDHYLIAAAIAQHTQGGPPDLNARVASLDHAMWFHRPGRVDEWLLYSLDSPSTSGARGLARGSIFSRDGRLIATTAQEGLMRLNNPSAAPPGQVRPAGD